MGQYVARKRAKFKGFSGPVNIPWGAVLEEQDGLLFGVELRLWGDQQCLRLLLQR